MLNPFTISVVLSIKWKCQWDIRENPLAWNILPDCYKLAINSDQENSEKGHCLLVNCIFSHTEHYKQ
jgi:hypothetical protein